MACIVNGERLCTRDDDDVVDSGCNCQNTQWHKSCLLQTVSSRMNYFHKRRELFHFLTAFMLHIYNDMSYIFGNDRLKRLAGVYWQTIEEQRNDCFKVFKCAECFSEFSIPDSYHVSQLSPLFVIMMCLEYIARFLYERWKMIVVATVSFFICTRMSLASLLFVSLFLPHSYGFFSLVYALILHVVAESTLWAGVILTVFGLIIFFILHTFLQFPIIILGDRLFIHQLLQKCRFSTGMLQKCK